MPRLRGWQQLPRTIGWPTSAGTVDKSLVELLCQVHLLLVLLAATVPLTLPYFPLVLVLLLLELFVTLSPLHPRLDVIINITIVFLLPLALEQLLQYLALTIGLTQTTFALAIFRISIPQIMAVVAILPVIYLLDQSLRESARSLVAVQTTSGRHLTATGLSFFIASPIILVISAIIGNSILFLTSIAVILYLLVILARIIKAVPGLPLNLHGVEKRVVAGATVSLTLHADSKASIPMHCRIGATDSWVKSTPKRFSLRKAQKKRLNLLITPPLAGLSQPEFQLSVLDAWGFTQLDRQVSPIELHVIPRAKYAEWLALKYLGETGDVTSGEANVAKESLLLKRGSEYYDSRAYQPGDEVQRVDWKHTLKLQQLIIKEYTEAGGQTAILVVNLCVANLREADELAYTLITTALTLAEEEVPTALAVYDQEKVILITLATSPREILKRALSLVKEIIQIDLAHRYLYPPDIRRLRRNMSQLRQVSSEPAQRLLEILHFEYQAMESAANNHPLAQALAQVTKRLPPPGVVLLVSKLNHDVEAVPVITHRLSRRGFSIMPVAAS
ncbi:DUF58 domain-containing protein [Chloroflexota bacterium]